MERLLQNPRLWTVLFALLSASTQAITNWTITIPTTATGSFSASESTTSSTVSGTYTRQANGFIQLSVTAGTGSTAPSNGTVKYAIEIPGFMMATEPLLTDEKRIITTVSTGSCPTLPFTGILGYSIWSGTAGTSYDVTDSTIPAFGVFTWDPATNLATISDLRNLTSYASLAGFVSFNLTGTCTNGVINFTGPGDRGGNLYVTNSNGGLYVTNTNRAIMILPQVSIPAASVLNDTYAVWEFDESFHTSIFGSRITIAGGTSASGDRRSDMGTDAAETASSWSFSNITINSPITGMFTADISLEGSANTNCACAVYLRNKKTIFCVAQMPNAANRPMNFIMASDARPYVATTLDTYQFGTGKVTTTFANAAEEVRGMVLQSDGRIVTAGYTGNDFAVSRYLKSGTLDTTFNTTGKVTTAVSGGAADAIYGVALDSLGNIVVAGYVANATNDVALARYTSTGALDTTFDTDGIFTTTFSSGAERAHAVAVDSSNRVLIAGYTQGTSDDILTARFTTTGALDSTFSTNAFDIQGGSRSDIGYAITIQSDNKILTAGIDATTGANSDMYVIRYLTTGALDTSLDTDGLLTINCSSKVDGANAIAVQSDGKIVVGGYVEGDNFAIARVSTTGALDTTFGTTGKIITSVSTTQNDRIQGVALQTDGAIVAVGYMNNGTTDDFAVVRYLSNGTLDTTFDTDGMWTNDFVASAGDRANAVAIQSDEMILIGGYATNANTDFAIMRIWP